MRAQDEGGLKPYVAFGLNISQGDSRDLTQNGLGVESFTGEFGVQFPLGGTSLNIRPNLGMSKLAGTTSDPRSGVYDMMAIYGALDVVYAPFKKWEWAVPVTLSTGPTLLTWNVDELYPPPGGGYNQGDKGLKIGWRLGAGYEINSKIRVELTYTLSEWRSDNTLPYRSGWNPSRPSYFCLKASYSY
jgi:hypothetical protein